MNMRSGLALIKVNNKFEPLCLFKEWLEEAKTFTVAPLFMTLSTATRNGKVSDRVMTVRDLLPEGTFSFIANCKSRKIQDIMDNPQVAANFSWIYCKDKTKIFRQVRIEGVTESLSREQACIYYQADPLYCKIRAHICPQSEPVDWDDLKRKHDNLLKEVVENGLTLDMPDNLVAYQLVPKVFDFYYACDENIGDRILFQNIDNIWKMQRISV